MDKDKLISQMKDLLRRSKDALELEYGEENELVSDIKIVLAKNISLNPDVSGRSEQLVCVHQWRGRVGDLTCVKCGVHENYTT